MSKFAAVPFASWQIESEQLFATKIGIGSQAGTLVPPVPAVPAPEPALPVAVGHNDGSTVPGQPAALSANRTAPVAVDHRGLLERERCSPFSCKAKGSLEQE